jgi:hypothetical protein
MLSLVWRLACSCRHLLTSADPPAHPPQSALLTRACLVLSTSLWSYNALLTRWEPVMEPTQLILHSDANQGARPSSGVQPGTWLRLTSSNSCVHITLAYAALNSLLEALEDGRRLRQLKGAQRRRRAAGRGRGRAGPLRVCGVVVGWWWR